MSKPFYIYRNLNRGCFSVKWGSNGRVRHVDALTMIGVRFKVSEAGRLRVVREGRKNVHAYVLADSVAPIGGDRRALIDVLSLQEITYNPYRLGAFVWADTGEPVPPQRVAFAVDGKVWAAA